MKNKKLLITLGIVLVILLIALFAVYINRRTVKESKPVNSVTVYSPKFMTEQEKAALDLKTNLKIQVLKKSPEGKIEVYKIIRNKKDIINNPTEVGPISPNLK